MIRLPLLSGREIVKAFYRRGFRFVHQRGSHIKIRHESSGTTLIIPNYKEVDRSLLKDILKEAKMSEEEFLKLL